MLRLVLRAIIDNKGASVDHHPRLRILNFCGNSAITIDKDKSQA